MYVHMYCAYECTYGCTLIRMGELTTEQWNFLTDGWTDGWWWCISSSSHTRVPPAAVWPRQHPDRRSVGQSGRAPPPPPPPATATRPAKAQNARDRRAANISSALRARVLCGFWRISSVRPPKSSHPWWKCCVCELWSDCCVVLLLCMCGLWPIFLVSSVCWYSVGMYLWFLSLAFDHFGSSTNRRT